MDSTWGAQLIKPTHTALADERNRDIAIYINGAFYPRDEAKISVFDSGFLVGDGVWEGIRLHKGRFAFLDRHMERLFAGLATIDLDIGMTAAELEEELRTTVARNNMTDHVHVRLMITRGNKSTPFQHPDNVISGPNIVIVAEHNLADPSIRANGISLFTSTVRRPPPDTLDQRLNSHSKLHEVIALIQATKAGAHEALMLDPTGAVATCNATNFFVIRRGDIWTSTGHYNLKGITPGVVLEVARNAGMTTREQPFSLTDVYSADEAFVTGTVGALTPVIEVDGRTIGNGTPGATTARLQDLYDAAVASVR